MEKQRFTCNWPFETLVILSDGKVVCGCADPFGERPLGDTQKQSLYEIWNSETIRALRNGLNNGYAPFCEPCGLKCRVGENDGIPQRSVQVNALPRVFIENSVGCNLNCFKAVCNHESGITGTRTQRMMPYEDFVKLFDQIGRKLNRLDFFNYGEPFVHPRAVDMLEYVKTRYPHVFCYVSTNGLLLDKEKMCRLVDIGMDEVTFSVDGPDQETYVKYRCKGKFDRVFNNMKELVAERDRRGREYPLVNWRYILFNWNDSDRKMNKARKMARKIGVDKLVWEITDHPEEAKSEKYQIGTPGWKRIFKEIWDTSSFSNAIRNKKYIAKLRLISKKHHFSKDHTFTMTLRITNKGFHTWQKAALGFIRSVRLGGQLYDENKNLINRDFAREFIPEDAPRGKTFTMDIEIPAIEDTGVYYLKFDMVSEGIDWFENNHSPVAWAKVLIE